jgi:hypothetical protein
MILRKNKPLAPLAVLFVVLNALLIFFRRKLESKGVNADVVIGGNIILFLITVLSFLLAKKGLNQSNPHAFVRSIYSSMMIKLFVCIIAAFAYFYVAGKEINKPALFICMGLYLVYTFLEVSVLTKMLRSKPHV